MERQQGTEWDRVHPYPLWFSEHAKHITKSTIKKVIYLGFSILLTSI